MAAASGSGTVRGLVVPVSGQASRTGTGRTRKDVMRLSTLPRSAMAVLAMALFMAGAPVQAQSSSACTFKPRVGQSGKDVVWVPTPDAVVDRMLRMAQVTPGDYVVDLGSGDGKIVILAAQRFGVRGLGIEYDPDMVELSRCLAREARVAEMTRFERGDIFASDFTQATVVTMYLLPELNRRLRPLLFARMKPGTRIVSHQFTMGDWQPDESSSVDDKASHFWVIPANAGGHWKLTWRGEPGEGGGDLTLVQTFQKIGGRVRFRELEAGLRDARLRGDRIAFELMDETGVLRSFTGRILGDRIEGTALGPDGRPVAFTAVRVGAAPPIGGSTD